MQSNERMRDGSFAEIKSKSACAFCWVRTAPRTVYPFSSRARTAQQPTYPLAPVTSIVAGGESADMIKGAAGRPKGV